MDVLLFTNTTLYTFLSNTIICDIPEDYKKSYNFTIFNIEALHSTILLNSTNYFSLIVSDLNMVQIEGDNMYSASYIGVPYIF